MITELLGLVGGFVVDVGADVLGERVVVVEPAVDGGLVMGEMGGATGFDPTSEVAVEPGWVTAVVPPPGLVASAGFDPAELQATEPSATATVMTNGAARSREGRRRRWASRRCRRFPPGEVPSVALIGRSPSASSRLLLGTPPGT